MACCESPEAKDEGDLKHKLKPIRISSESGTEDVYYPSQYGGLPEEAELYAEKELNETKENKANGIRKLKEYIKRENLTCPDDTTLLTVLRHSKYNFKKAETKLKQFLKLRQYIIDKVAQMDTNMIGLILEEFIFLCLPYRDKYGRAIVYTQSVPSIDKYKEEDIVICGMAGVLYFLTFPMSSIYGFTHLGDSSAPHLPVYYPIFKIMKMIMSHMKALPLRLAKIELFNEHFLCRWCVNMLLPFMPDKISKRVTFHGSGFDSVHKVFHPDILPYEIGGTLGPISIEHYKEELLYFIETLKEENSAKDL